jgi:hypothetical protein
LGTLDITVGCGISHVRLKADAVDVATDATIHCSDVPAAS